MLNEAKKIVDMALKMGADESEAFIIKSEGRSFVIEKNSISSISGGMERGIGIRVISKRRVGFSFCTDIKKAEEAIKQALSLSKLGKESDFSFLEAQKYNPVLKTFDERIQTYTAESAIKGALQLIDSALGVDSDVVLTRGGMMYGSEAFVITNSKGLEVEDRGTGIGAGVSCVLKRKEMSTGFESRSLRTLEIDFEEVGRRAATLAREGQGAKKIDGKEMTVVFTPQALSNFLEYITAPALYGEAFHKGESVYSNRLGEQVAQDFLSLTDDGSLPGGLNSATTDDEGFPSQKNVLIERGFLKGCLYAQSSAIEYKRPNTGSAMRTERLATSRSYKSPPVVRARNMVLEGGNTKMEDLILGIKDGVIVHEILGAHTANPVSGDFSVNSSMLFKIEHGEVAYPVKSAMLSGNFHECLKKVNALGDDYMYVSGGLTPIAFYIPTMSVEGIRVTG